MKLQVRKFEPLNSSSELSPTLHRSSNTWNAIVIKLLECSLVKREIEYRYILRHLLSLEWEVVSWTSLIYFRVTNTLLD
jgi:hypothetical protein